MTIDEAALKDSFLLDGKPLVDTRSISIEYPTTHSLRIRLKGLDTDKKQILTLKASLYNDASRVAHRLPSDITLETTSSVPTIVSRTVGIPREKRYSIDLVGFPKGIDSSMVKLYQVAKDAIGSSCMIDSIDYSHPIKYETLALYDSEMKDTLDIASSHPIHGSYCLYAGLSGQLYEMDNRTVNLFTLTGSAIDILAPEYDMQSRLQFDFSNPLFEDIGSTNSREYITERTKQKELLLKHLSIIPEVPLSIDNIILTPTRTIIALPLIAGLGYTVKLDTIEDIYGQLASTSLSLAPKRESYLSLALSGHTNTLPVSNPVWAKMYALDTKRSSHDVMLCKVGVEVYARFERILDENKKEYSAEMYDTL